MTRLQNKLNKRNQLIISMYQSGNYKTESIAEQFGITSRSIQRLLNKAGVIRTQAESNKISAKFKNYYRKPEHLKAKRKWLTPKRRYLLIKKHPYCSNCGLTVEQGIRLEVDHINEIATDNRIENLQVLCNQCNTGKSHLSRFGDNLK